MTIRVNKTKDYTVMSNYHLRDNTISLKAKGLLSQMLSLPDNWDYTIEGLASINKESRSAIESALDELKKAKYLVITKLMPNETKSGRIEYQYDIYEQPTDIQGVEKQGVEKQGVEFQGVENRQQINTNKQSTDKQNTKDKIKTTNRSPIDPPTRFVKPTVEEVKAYCIERGNSVDAQKWFDYYTANGWKVGRNPMKDWKAAVRTWERTEKKKHVDYEAMARDLAMEMI